MFGALLDLKLNFLWLRTIAFVHRYFFCYICSHLRHLATLDVSHNKIENISESAFDKLPYLESIDISSNRLRKFPGKLKMSTKLEELNLSSNYLTTLSSSVMKILKPDRNGILFLGKNELRCDRNLFKFFRSFSCDEKSIKQLRNSGCNQTLEQLLQDRFVTQETPEECVAVGGTKNIHKLTHDLLPACLLYSFIDYKKYIQYKPQETIHR